MAAADDGQRMAGSHTLQGGVASTDLNSLAIKQEPCRRSRRRKWLPKVDGAAADLRDQAMAGREIGAIAFERDFSDLSHFTRRFKQRFGCRPRDGREMKLVARELLVATQLPRCPLVVPAKAVTHTA